MHHRCTAGEFPLWNGFIVYLMKPAQRGPRPHLLGRDGMHSSRLTYSLAYEHMLRAHVVFFTPLLFPFINLIKLLSSKVKAISRSKCKVSLQFIPKGKKVVFTSVLPVGPGAVPSVFPCQPEF